MLRRTSIFALAGLVAYGVLGFVIFLGSGTIASASSPTDSAIRTALQQQLTKKLPGVTVKVEDRVATLEGTADNYMDKLKAEHIAKSYSALTRIENLVEVGGPAIDDNALAQTLARKLATSDSMRGNIFDDYSLEVRNGVVIITGYAHNQFSHNDALVIVQSEKGVKDVIDQIWVLPLSPSDDHIRMAAARRIYESGNLSRYLVDPAQPIRIIVNNGNITLDGAVANKMDRQLAEMAADSVPGVFSVTDNIKIDSKS